MRVKRTASAQTGSGAERLCFDHFTRPMTFGLRSRGTGLFAPSAPLRTTLWFQCSKSGESTEFSRFYGQNASIKSSEVELGYFPWGDSGRAGSRCDALVASTSRRAPVLAKQARMPLRGSGGDEHGRLTRDARITSCPASAIF